MKITKWVNVETELEFDVSAEDIAEAILEEPPEGVKAVLYGLNRIATFLRAVPDGVIAEMNDKQLKTIADCLGSQRDRYRNEGANAGRLQMSIDHSSSFQRISDTLAAMSSTVRSYGETVDLVETALRPPPPRPPDPAGWHSQDGVKSKFGLLLWAVGVGGLALIAFGLWMGWK